MQIEILVKFRFTDVKTIIKVKAEKVELPFWNGTGKDRQPFNNWKNNDSLPWYKTYNECKHDDHLFNFPKANPGNLIDAYCGLFVLLSSQFRTESFTPGDIGLEWGQ